jgi:hypothetical protein
MDKPFDPDEYLKGPPAAAPAFDPDEYIKGGSTEPISPAYQAAKDVTRLGAHALTFGGWPRVVGAAKSALGDQTYTQATGEELALNEAARKRLGPLYANMAEAAGGAASGLGLAKGGATLLGRVAGAPWWQQLAAGAGEAGAYGAAQGMGNTFSDNPQDYVTNALHGTGTGMAIGAGLPLLGGAASAIYRKGADMWAGVPTKLASAARADARGLTNLPDMGPEAMLVDAGPSMQSIGQAYVQGTGPYHSLIVDALMARDAGTAGRLQAGRQAALGPAKRASTVEAELDAERQATNTRYEPAMRGRAIDASGADRALAAIDNIAQARRLDLGEVTKSLTVPKSGNLPDLGPETWLNARHKVDSMIAQAGIAGDKYRVNNLTDVRAIIDARLANDIPGIKAIDADFAHTAQQGESFQLGRNIYETGKEAIHPQDLADSMAAGTPKTNQRLTQGAHADLERRLGVTPRELNTLETLYNAPWNREKSTLVFGEGPSEAVAKSIAANRQFRETYDRIARGSDTAQRKAALADNELTPLEGRPAPTAYGRAEQLGLWLIDKARTANQEQRRAEIARRIVLQGQEMLAERNRLLEHNAGVVPRAAAVDKYTRAAGQGGIGAILAPFFNR